MYNNQDKDKEHLLVKAKPVYKFIERCKDLKYILKSKIVFKRYTLCTTKLQSRLIVLIINCGYLVTNFNKTINRLNVYDLEVSKPNFSFTPGEYFVKFVDDNEHDFDVIIYDLKNPLINIFNVLDDVWAYHIKK